MVSIAAPIHLDASIGIGTSAIATAASIPAGNIARCVCASLFAVDAVNPTRCWVWVVRGRARNGIDVESAKEEEGEGGGAEVELHRRRRRRLVIVGFYAGVLLD